MEEDQKQKVGGFVQMSMMTMHDILKAGGGYYDLAAYIVLCGGVDGRRPGRVCTHGAKSISERLGATYRTAQKSLEWLQEHGFIVEGPLPENSSGNALPRSRAPRWFLQDGDLDIAVSKMFIDGAPQAKRSPLQQIIFDVDGLPDVPRARAVCDAILVYAAMMLEMDFGAYGGVDPTKWVKKYRPIKADECGDGSEHVVKVPEANALLVTVIEDESATTKWRFIYQTLGEDYTLGCCDESLADRFFHAITSLMKLKLLYSAMILWSGNPLADRQAAPIATQYINSHWARGIDPHCQYVTNNAAWRSGARDAYLDFTAEEGPAFLGSGSYRYMVAPGQVDSVVLLEQLRVRYWPPNAATVSGREAEKARTERYSSAIDALARR